MKTSYTKLIRDVKEYKERFITLTIIIFIGTFIFSGLMNSKFIVNYNLNSYFESKKGLILLGIYSISFLFLFLSIIISLSTISSFVKMNSEDFSILLSLGIDCKPILYIYAFIFSLISFISSITGSVIGTLLIPKTFAYFMVKFGSLPSISINISYSYIPKLTITVTILTIICTFISCKKIIKKYPYDIFEE